MLAVLTSVTAPLELELFSISTRLAVLGALLHFEGFVLDHPNMHHRGSRGSISAK